jgi:hypothetical protein
VAKVEAIKGTIEKVIQALETAQKEAARDNPEVLLKKVLTKKELGHIKFQYLKHGVLHMGVDSSTRLYQLSLQKEGLLAKLRKKSSAIKDIRFRLGATK